MHDDDVSGAVILFHRILLTSKVYLFDIRYLLLEFHLEVSFFSKAMINTFRLGFNRIIEFKNIFFIQFKGTLIK